MKTFTSMQDYFNQTIQHLLAQKSKCLNSNDFCAYLNDEGNKCAIGYWIPEDHEALEFIGTVSGLIAKYPDLKGVVCPQGMEGAELAKYLQYLHDEDEYRLFPSEGTKFTEEGISMIKKICKKFDLVEPIGLW